MTDTSELEAGCFRYYLQRTLQLEGALPRELKREITAVLMICDAGRDVQKALAERNRRIRMLNIICKVAFKRIATLEQSLRLLQESTRRLPDGGARLSRTEI